MKKRIILREGNTNKGGTFYIKITDKDTGREFMKKLHNDTTVGGSTMFMSKMFNLPALINPIYELSSDPNIGIESIGTLTLQVDSPSDPNSRRIFGFALGVDGGSDVNVAAMQRGEKGWVDGRLIPFKYSVEEDSGAGYGATQEYAVRRSYNGGIAYYAKLLTFDHYNQPVGQSRLSSSVNPHDAMVGSTNAIQTIGETTTEISSTDMVDYFKDVKNNLNSRYFNSVKILAGRQVTSTINGVTRVEYRDVIVTNVLNMKPVSLGAKNKIDIIYKMEF